MTFGMLVGIPVAVAVTLLAVSVASMTRDEGNTSAVAVSVPVGRTMKPLGLTVEVPVTVGASEARAASEDVPLTLAVSVGFKLASLARERGVLAGPVGKLKPGVDSPVGTDMTGVVGNVGEAPVPGPVRLLRESGSETIGEVGS
jgi:hypothetical protein